MQNMKDNKKEGQKTSSYADATDYKPDVKKVEDQTNPNFSSGGNEPCEGCEEGANCNCAELEAKNVDLDSKLRRVLADYANLQMDNQKRLDITMNQLKAKTAREIIAVLDDVNFAMQAKEKMQIDEKVKVWVDGLLSTLAKLNKSLEVLGVVPMELKSGDVFDSARHEALGVVYEGEPETIQTVVQVGYIMAGTDIVVRPARVIVCKAN
jgi:molecular chaperone GrpE